MRSARFLSRRTFLQGAAGAAVGLPLLESIGASPLQAQSAKRVTRFLSFHSSCGVETDRFWPAVGRTIVFTYKGDLYRVPATGGSATGAGRGFASG